MFHEAGIVERLAIFPARERPKIVYRLSSIGIELLSRLDEVIEEYEEKRLESYDRDVEELDNMLVRGHINEEVYLKRLKELEMKYNVSR